MDSDKMRRINKMDNKFYYYGIKTFECCVKSGHDCIERRTKG